MIWKVGLKIPFIIGEKCFCWVCVYTVWRRCFFFLLCLTGHTYNFHWFIDLIQWRTMVSKMRTNTSFIWLICDYKKKGTLFPRVFSVNSSRKYGYRRQVRFLSWLPDVMFLPVPNSQMPKPKVLYWRSLGVWKNYLMISKFKFIFKYTLPNLTWSRSFSDPTVQFHWTRSLSI